MVRVKHEGDSSPLEEPKDLLDEISEQLKEDYKRKKEAKKLLAKNSEVPEDVLKILKDKDIFKKITEEEFDKKIVGEVETRKVIFLCAFGGRLVENCQIASYNLLINDDAGTGKDYIARAVLELLPKENYIHKTRISPTVFTYWHNSEYEPDWTWDGKVFYPEDISEVVLNSDVFKVMCSSGTSAMITVKNKAVDIQIKGKPVMITTTASAVPNPELVRRFVILNLDSSQQQTKAIMKRHSEFKMKGIVPEYNSKYKEAFGYLKRVKVKIPFCDLIDKYFPSKNVIMRTHYPRFLDFICASAGLHQFQRKIDDEGFILATGDDYDIARGCILKLTSNRFMIPLSIHQKKILDIFEKNPNISGTATDLHSNRGMNFISEKALITNLGILSSYGILETQSEEVNYRERIAYFLARGYRPNERIEIPTFQDICRITTVGINDKVSNIDTVGNITNFTIDTQNMHTKSQQIGSLPSQSSPSCLGKNQENNKIRLAKEWEE